jgi:hypothetical protein
MREHHAGASAAAGRAGAASGVQRLRRRFRNGRARSGARRHIVCTNHWDYPLWKVSAHLVQFVKIVKKNIRFMAHYDRTGASIAYALDTALALRRRRRETVEREAPGDEGQVWTIEVNAARTVSQNGVACTPNDRAAALP